MDSNTELVNRLKQDILRMQGFAPVKCREEDKIGLGPLEMAFPNGVFPKSVVHEFISENREQLAATCGFVGGILSHLMGKKEVCIWISTTRRFFPSAAKAFGVEPDRIIFICMPRERDVLWAVEEALKCKGVTIVVAELQEMDFVQSRRLQLIVEKSRATGLILKNSPRKMGATACAARWHITSLPSIMDDGMPGVGSPRWKVTLLKVRSGHTGTWHLGWNGNSFIPEDKESSIAHKFEKEARIG
ncbi:ImuA family protein [Sphingobacterium lactis]|uniref:ImuA family protein n=1 Tax=Sphingobacterium TaxID=28453 RepID=UPI0021A3106D|nr:Error-prone repair protein ImuA [Sphingobacterium hotanense]MCT1526065.1 Error-prone repair protein ImuA [Sphingobacterium hotanense]